MIDHPRPTPPHVQETESESDFSTVVDRLDALSQSMSLRPGDAQQQAELAGIFSDLVAKAEKRGKKEEMENALLKMAKGGAHDRARELIAGQVGNRFDRLHDLRSSTEPDTNGQRRDELAALNVKLAGETSVDYLPPEDANGDWQEETRDAAVNEKAQKVSGQLIRFRALSRAIRKEVDSQKKNNLVGELATLMSDLTAEANSDDERHEIEDLLLELGREDEADIDAVKNEIVSIVEGGVETDDNTASS